MNRDGNPCSWGELDALLGSRRTRKVQNNTYVQRRGDDIAVMLHETDIVTYRLDDILRLDSGGWLTDTTRARMNDWTPSEMIVYTLKGRWMVSANRYNVGYADGITFLSPAIGGVTALHHYLGPTDIARQDAHNRSVDRLITHCKKLNALPHVQCGLCVPLGGGAIVGDRLGTNQHLVDHLLNNELPRYLLLAAKQWAGRSGTLLGDAQINRVDAQINRVLRDFLRSRLYQGAVAIRHGRHPLPAPLTATEAS